jgi:hypothetical protein
LIIGLDSLFILFNVLSLSLESIINLLSINDLLLSFLSSFLGLRLGDLLGVILGVARGEGLSISILSGARLSVINQE